MGTLSWIPLLLSTLGATSGPPLFGPEGTAFTLQFDVSYAADVFGGGPWDGVTFAYTCTVSQADARGTWLTCSLDYATSFTLEQTEEGVVRNVGASAALAPTVQVQYDAAGGLLNVTAPPSLSSAPLSMGASMAARDGFLSLALPLPGLEERGRVVEPMPEAWSFIAEGSGQPVSKVHQHLRRRKDNWVVKTRGGMTQPHAGSAGQTAAGNTLSRIHATAILDPASGQIRSRHVEVTFGYQVPVGYRLTFDIASHLNRTIDVKRVDGGAPLPPP